MIWCDELHQQNVRTDICIYNGTWAVRATAMHGMSEFFKRRSCRLLLSFQRPT